MLCVPALHQLAQASVRVISITGYALSRVDLSFALEGPMSQQVKSKETWKGIPLCLSFSGIFFIGVDDCHGLSQDINL